MRDWLTHMFSTPLNQLHWWELVIFAVLWFAVAAAIWGGLELCGYVIRRWFWFRRRRRR